jgi:hypothetical protein
VTVQQLLDAVAQLKYRPGIDGPVSAATETSAVSVAARSAEPAHRAKSEGAIVITLGPKAGHQLGGEGLTPTKIEVVGTEKVTIPEGQGQVSVPEALTASREVRIPIKIEPKTPDGEQLVTVKVTFQSKRGDKSAAERTVELRVPVVVR